MAGRIASGGLGWPVIESRAVMFALLPELRDIAVISISSRYLHPSHDSILLAMERLGGHKIGHSEEKPSKRATSQRQLTQQ